MLKHFLNLFSPKKTIEMPQGYLEFLKKIPVGGKKIHAKKYVNYLSLADRDNVEKQQHGYSYNPIKKLKITVWPEKYLVIGHDGGDPYVIDTTDTHLSVYTAVHGTGDWKFKKIAKSLEEFAESVGIK